MSWAKLQHIPYISTSYLAHATTAEICRTHQDSVEGYPYLIYTFRYVSEKLLVYPDGAADQTVPVVDFEDPLEQLVSGHLVRRHLTLQQVHWLGDAAGKVHQGVGRVPPIQSLVAAINPEGGAGMERQEMFIRASTLSPLNFESHIRNF